MFTKPNQVNWIIPKSPLRLSALAVNTLIKIFLHPLKKALFVGVGVGFKIG